MKRLALVLAAAVLGTGCIDHTCDRTVTVDWQFRTYLNAVTSSCSGAGVDELDLYADNQYVGTFPCAGPAVSVLVPRGTVAIGVDAVDVQNHLGLGANRIAYRDDVTVDATACGDHALLTEPAEAQVNLDYATDAAPACAGGPCAVTFSVHDDVTPGVAASSAQLGAVTYPADVLLRLPVGAYTVTAMQVVSGGVAEKSACTHPTFTVARPDSGVQPQVVPASSPVLLKSSCP